MVLKFSETVQLSLGSSAELPQQALALTLSDDVLEDMIECIQNGQEIQLSLGDAPVSVPLSCFLSLRLFLEGWRRGEGIVRSPRQ